MFFRSSALPPRGAFRISGPAGFAAFGLDAALAAGFSAAFAAVFSAAFVGALAAALAFAGAFFGLCRCRLGLCSLGGLGGLGRSGRRRNLGQEGCRGRYRGRCHRGRSHRGRSHNRVRNRRRRFRRGVGSRRGRMRGRLRFRHRRAALSPGHGHDQASNQCHNGSDRHGRCPVKLSDHLGHAKGHQAHARRDDPSAQPGRILVRYVCHSSSLPLEAALLCRAF